MLCRVINPVTALLSPAGRVGQHGPASDMSHDDQHASKTASSHFSSKCQYKILKKLALIRGAKSSFLKTEFFLQFHKL